MDRKLTPEAYLRILTGSSIKASDIALLQGCSTKTAREIVRRLAKDGRIRSGCLTDDYLRLYKGTTRKEELKIIYGKEWT